MFHHFSVLRSCGLTGTVLGPGLGASGSRLGVGEGVDRLCGLTGMFFVAILTEFSLDKMIKSGKKIKNKAKQVINH